MAAPATKKLPNILVTGTPGTGKTQHCAALRDLIAFNFLNVSEMVVKGGLHLGFDEVMQTYILDEDRVLDELEVPMAEGGCVVDHHSSDFFPERFFQLVVVLQTDNTILYDRLVARDYSQAKLDVNMTAEIMQESFIMAEDSYDPSIVVALESNTSDQMASNVQRILAWINAYMTAEDSPQDEQNFGVDATGSDVDANNE